MTVLYPYVCNKEGCYKGNVLYLAHLFLRIENKQNFNDKIVAVVVAVIAVFVAVVVARFWLTAFNNFSFTSQKSQLSCYTIPEL